MTSPLPYDAAIVGAGVAGSVVAATLARHAPLDYRALLVDADDAGAGTAYRGGSERLLMNGPVRAMSVMPGDERHLERYAAGEHPDALLSRSRFGEYARATLRDALVRHRGISFERREIVDIEPHQLGYALRDARGGTIVARNVVLALGNFPPDDRFVPAAVRAHPGYVPNPWRFDPNAIDGDAVALVGSGLTSMDVVALLDEHGYDGTIHVISRHGLLPHLERPEVRGLPLEALALDWTTPQTLVRTMREAAARHAAAGGDWRAVAESIRRVSPEIWAAWTVRQRKQFLRHVQPQWSAHRYRVPAATLAAFERFERMGRIVRHRGRIDGATLREGALALSLRRAGTRSTIVVDAVVNCTGPQGNYAALTQPLVRNARNRGLLRPDTLHLGIDATVRYNAIDASGTAQPHLFAIGPPLRGLLYESTAVPETRDQAARVAGALAELHEPATAGMAS